MRPPAPWRPPGRRRPAGRRTAASRSARRGSTAPSAARHRRPSAAAGGWCGPAWPPGRRRCRSRGSPPGSRPGASGCCRPASTAGDRSSGKVASFQPLERLIGLCAEAVDRVQDGPRSLVILARLAVQNELPTLRYVGLDLVFHHEDCRPAKCEAEGLQDLVDRPRDLVEDAMNHGDCLLDGLEHEIVDPGDAVYYGLDARLDGARRLLRVDHRRRDCGAAVLDGLP